MKSFQVRRSRRNEVLLIVHPEGVPTSIPELLESTARRKKREVELKCQCPRDNCKEHGVHEELALDFSATRAFALCVPDWDPKGRPMNARIALNSLDFTMKGWCIF